MADIPVDNKIYVTGVLPSDLPNLTPDSPMSGNPSIAASNKPEHIRIKTPAELTEELELRQKLHIQYRYVCSFD